MEEGDTKSKSPKEDGRASSRLSRQPSWQAFKRKKGLNQGAVNSSFQSDNLSNSRSNQSLNRQLVDYNQHMPSSPTASKPSYGVNLGYNPGESSDSAGFCNPAYDPAQSETSFNSDRSSLTMPISADVAPEVQMRRQQSNPVERARSQILEQPGLAGHGALSMQVNTAMEKPPPRIASVTDGANPRFEPVDFMPIKPNNFQPDVPWEFPRERLYIRQKLGEGSFGEVWRAKADGILQRTDTQVVAVKMLKGTDVVNFR